MSKAKNLKYHCDKCGKVISISEADVSYAYTDKAYILCTECYKKYKAEQLGDND